MVPVIFDFFFILKNSSPLPIATKVSICLASSIYYASMSSNRKFHLNLQKGILNITLEFIIELVLRYFIHFLYFKRFKLSLAVLKIATVVAHLL